MCAPPNLQRIAQTAADGQEPLRIACEGRERRHQARGQASIARLAAGMYSKAWSKNGFLKAIVLIHGAIIVP